MCSTVCDAEIENGDNNSSSSSSSRCTHSLPSMLLSFAIFFLFTSNSVITLCSSSLLLWHVRVANSYYNIIMRRTRTHLRMTRKTINAEKSFLIPRVLERLREREIAAKYFMRFIKMLQWTCDSFKQKKTSTTQGVWETVTKEIFKQKLNKIRKSKMSSVTSSDKQRKHDAHFQSHFQSHSAVL